MSAWQPIETAPLGAEVLTARKKRYGRGFVIEGMIKCDADSWWITADGDRPQQPIYWQPLPPPPAD